MYHVFALRCARAHTRHSVWALPSRREAGMPGASDPAWWQMVRLSWHGCAYEPLWGAVSGVRSSGQPRPAPGLQRRL